MNPEDADKLRLHLGEFGVDIVFKPTDFTQVNHALNETMVSRAVHLLGVKPGHKVADFFCGLGNFTLPLARCAAHVTGLEGSDGLVARARAGAEMNGLAEKTDFIARNLFTWSADDWNALWERSGGIDRVLIDPPREGAQALAQVLAKTDKRPARVVYVSCNPATLARDCAILHHEGGWHIRAAGVMNMFPHTGHVESMAVLEPGPKPEKKPEEPVAAESLQTPETTAKDAASKVPEDCCGGLNRRLAYFSKKRKEEMAIQRTLSIIKPDAVAKNVIGKIYSRFETNGLRIVAAQMRQLSRAEAEGFYAVHRERPFFKALVDFMISGPVMIQVLEGENAIAKNRELMGATDPKKAEKGTIRADFAESIDANAVHGSDAPETAAVEIAYFFPTLAICKR